MANYIARYIPAPRMVHLLTGRPGIQLKKLDGGLYQVTRVINGSNERSVVDEICKEGGSPLEIRKYVKTFLNTEVITKRYRIMFLQALAFNAEAGMSAGKALEVVIRNEPNVAKQLELAPGVDVLNKGGSFSDALDAISLFDQITISILLAGERTGALKEALASAVAHYDDKNATSKTIFGMIGLVVFDLFTVVSTSLGVQFVLIPTMEKAGIDSKDPLVIEEFARQIQLGYLMNGTLLAIAVLIVIATTVFTYFLTSKTVSPLKERFEKILRGVPLVSNFLTHTAISDTFAISATMLEGGCRFPAAVELAAGATGYPPVRHFWEHVKKQLMLGSMVAHAMKHKPITDIEYMIIASHRSSKQLTKVFRDIAKERASQAADAAKTLNRVIIGGSVAYATASVLIYLWLLVVQNKQVMQGMGA